MQAPIYMHLLVRVLSCHGGSLDVVKHAIILIDTQRSIYLHDLLFDLVGGSGNHSFHEARMNIMDT